MSVRYAESHVDRLFAERDLIGIYQVISVLGKERALPEEFSFFCQVYQLFPARSGIWQHYENLPEEKFEQMYQALRRYGFLELADNYSLGKSMWNDQTRAQALDTWLDENADRIHESVFQLILPLKDSLKIEA